MAEILRDVYAVGAGGPAGKRRGRWFELPRITAEAWDRDQREILHRHEPVIVAGALPAEECARWSPSELGREFAQELVDAWTGVPRHGVPYAAADDMALERQTFGSFLDMLEAGQAGYLAQQPITRFPGLIDRLPIRTPKLERRHGINLWIGRATRSGMHFDSADNLFVQLHGHKRLLLAAPGPVRRMYPLPDLYTKSSLDFEDPDVWSKHRRLSSVRFASWVLGPGDVLYLPCGWWHYFAGDELTVSLNFWFGRSLTRGAKARAFARSGGAVWRRTASDFVRLGLLGRPLEQRPYSPPPTGYTLARRILR